MKAKEPIPDIYKVIYKLARWKTKSERYFTAFDQQQAFDDFHYAFCNGHVNSKKVCIYDIQRYDRFANKWYSVINDVNELPSEGCKINRKRHIILEL